MKAAEKEAIADAYTELLGSENVVTYEYLAPMLKKRINNSIAPTSGETGASADRPDHSICCVVYPQSQVQLSEAIALAHENKWRVIPCGNGSKIDWGGLASGAEVVVSTSRLNHLVEHAIGDLTVTVEAGINFIELQSVLAEANQFLAIDPAYARRSTLGGIVATGNSGSLRHRYNSVRDMCIGISFVRYDGEIAKAGGQVVKNVAGYDLMKLLTGSYGTLGIISQLTFRLYPLPEASGTVIVKGSNEAIARLRTELLSATLTPTVVDILSNQAMEHLGYGKSLGLVIRFQTIPASIKEQSDRVQELAKSVQLAKPMEVDVIAETAEADTWQAIDNLYWHGDRENYTRSNTALPQAIVAKIGVLTDQACLLITEIEAIVAQRLPNFTAYVRVHASSGLGILRLQPNENTGEDYDYQAIVAIKEAIDKIRYLVSRKEGFLSILEAPVALKQEIDIWDYSADTLTLMKKLKQEFDPQGMFSADRLV
ncbi:FAD linked oxidase domain protein [Thalassoporum mexicanum PCC 7367]|uniref:FAD-binding oxidoreductase n=1 Tax=Thalassoporum mexicanum TaxID=3457544 RepID=UPI00029FC2E1|nr:FAD-binding oxidoreductase [Pseudanabaena sp. PCC 7367]AFY71358.1 FAD linked oxidase domain protein [Pseudanabaena sp. PCC 7367]